MYNNRNFLLLWFVNVATTLAIELFTITVLVTVFDQTGSTLQAAGTMVARMLPAFLLGPIAGVLVDRLSRKNVLISMDLIRILFVGATLYLLQTSEQLSVTAIYLIIVGLAAASIFHGPARLALIPMLVGKEDLVRANSFIMASNQVSMALSYAVGGWLILALSLSQISLGVALLFALAIVAALLIFVPQGETIKEEGNDADRAKESWWQSFTAGWQYLRQHPIARPLTVMEVIEHVPHGIWTGALLLAFTIQALKGDTVDWGYQATGYFAGMIVGSLVAMAMSDWLGRHSGRVIVTTACLAGVMTLGFASVQTVWLSAIIAFAFGAPFAMRDVAQDSLLQSTVEEGQLGRVYATREMLRSVVFMFAGLFFAWLSDLVPIRMIYVTGGIIYLLTGLYALSNRALRASQMNPT